MWVGEVIGDRVEAERFEDVVVVEEWEVERV